MPIGFIPVEINPAVGRNELYGVELFASRLGTPTHPRLRKLLQGFGLWVWGRQPISLRYMYWRCKPEILNQFYFLEYMQYKIWMWARVNLWVVLFGWVVLFVLVLIAPDHSLTSRILNTCKNEDSHHGMPTIVVRIVWPYHTDHVTCVRWKLEETPTDPTPNWPPPLPTLE